MVTETIAPLFGLPVGPEVLIIILIAILLFGANKIPELARSTGEAMGEFQKGREEVEQELEEMRDTATGSMSTDTGSTGAGLSDTESTAGVSEAESADTEETSTATDSEDGA